MDLILLDMIMDPGIDGLDTYKHIRTINPNQKVVISSGYSETDRIKEALNLGVDGYLKKPYLMNDLKETLKEALD